jgi:prepilin-type N-terminal cleavage/methylation domain-containing protein
MKLKRENGLTLLEVMISIIILTIGLLGLAPLIILSIEGNNNSRDAMVASNIARDKIEWLESLDSIPSSAYSEVESDVQDGFNRTTVLTDHTSDPSVPEGLLRASIGVQWIDKTGMNRQTTVSTFLDAN